MDNLKNNNKIIFIPGWLDNGALHGYKNSLDIWNKNIDIKKNFGVSFVIAHSVGALAALYNWNIHRNFKIILINPVLLKKRIFKRWFKCMIYERTHYSLRRLAIFLSAVSALFKALKLFKVPVGDIIRAIPREDLTVIYGEKDEHLFDRELINSFNRNTFGIVKIKESGHNYDANIEQAIIKVIQ